MNIADERPSKFKYVSDGVPFEHEGLLYIKLDRKVKDADIDFLYNVVALESGALDFFNDDCDVKLVNAEVVVK